MIKAALRILTLLVGNLACADEWSRMASLPDQVGLAGSFAGVSQGALLVAGGANFPAAKPWEGGTKVWHDAVYVLPQPNGTWQLAGKLPCALGYGVSVTHASGVICVGGSNAERHYADVFRLNWQQGRLVRTTLPSLPTAVANACGALVGDQIYIAGGQSQANATETLKSFYRLDLASSNLQWKSLETWPGPGRMLAAASGCDGAFWLLGGTDLAPGKKTTGGNAPQGGSNVVRHYLKDAYRYDLAKGWKRIADLPSPAVGAPSPAADDGLALYLFGFDDGSQIASAPDEHRGFNKQILRYEVRSNTWKTAGQMPVAQIVTPCVPGNGGWIVPSGEIRPGIRSPEVWRWSPETQK